MGARADLHSALFRFAASLFRLSLQIIPCYPLIKFPATRNIFPDNLRRELREKLLQHSGFVQRNWPPRDQNRKIPCKIPC